MRTYGATYAAGPFLIDGFVDVGQLIAFFVDHPEVGVAAHDQEFVGLVFDWHPGSHGDGGQLIGRQRILAYSL